MQSPFRRALAILVLSAVLIWMTPACVFSQSPQAGIRIVAPEQGCVVRSGDPLTIMVIVSLRSVSSVAILCDDKGVGLLDKSPYSATLDTSTLAPGEHLLRAFAYLSDGEKVGAEPVTITVLPKESTSVSTSTGTARENAVQVMLKQGTPILLRTTRELRSGKTPKGSMVDYMVARDVLGPNQRVLIEYGANALGKVTDSRGRGMFGKNGKLEFTVEAVTAIDGTSIPLRGSEEASGRNNTGVMVVSALLLTVFAVFVHGRDITVPEGTEVAAYVDRDTVITTSVTRTGEMQGAPVESIVVRLPQGSRVKAGGVLRVEVTPQPTDKGFRLRLLCDGEEVLSRDGNFGPADVSTKNLSRGTHSLQAEVTFRSGLTVRETVEFEVD